MARKTHEEVDASLLRGQCPNDGQLLVENDDPRRGEGHTCPDCGFFYSGTLVPEDQTQ